MNSNPLPKDFKMRKTSQFMNEDSTKSIRFSSTIVLNRLINIEILDRMLQNLAQLSHGRHCSSMIGTYWINKQREEHSQIKRNK